MMTHSEIDSMIFMVRHGRGLSEDVAIAECHRFVEGVLRESRAEIVRQAKEIDGLREQLVAMTKKGNVA